MVMSGWQLEMWDRDLLTECLRKQTGQLRESGSSITETNSWRVLFTTVHLPGCVRVPEPDPSQLTHVFKDPINE